MPKKSISARIMMKQITQIPHLKTVEEIISMQRVLSREEFLEELMIKTICMFRSPIIYLISKR